MQRHSEEFTFQEVNDQTSKAFSLRKVYNTLSSHDFVFELPCKNDVPTCNDRRYADQGNF